MIDAPAALRVRSWQTSSRPLIVPGCLVRCQATDIDPERTSTILTCLPAVPILGPPASSVINRSIRPLQGAPVPDSRSDAWPVLRYDDWADTCATLHRWLQIVGKVRLAQTPWVNHQWHATLYLTSRGLTTSPIPHGQRTFQIDFDFLDHDLLIRGSGGELGGMGLRPRSVADFHTNLLGELERLGYPVRIHGSPNELPDPVPFAEDYENTAYDAGAVHRFWRALSSVDRVFQDFRGRFIGKCSPVHLFWGAMDLAVTRFSGERAPTHPGGIPHLPDWITREAYSHEVSSAGFWPGGPTYPEAIFYSYAYPEPDGFRAVPVAPPQARWSEDLQEFVLPYEAVRSAPDPENLLGVFLQSTYEHAADLGGWDRARVEWGPGGRPRRDG
jgi:hypothetical protein